MAANEKENELLKNRKTEAAGRTSDGGRESEYTIPNEVSCSPEFPQGCITAD